MDVSHLLDGLNEAQRDAVTAPAGSALVLAGAGSGKTRVLVHRIAWLVQVEGVSPWGILAVTFTNKAAREMRDRIEQLLGQPVGGMWVGTFHGLAHRLLRAHWQDAGLPQSFQILDSDDQQRLVKRVIRELNLDEAQVAAAPGAVVHQRQKDEGRRPQHLDDGGDPFQRQMIRIYERLRGGLRPRPGAVDFAELLLRAHELWRDRPDILHHYRQRFRHDPGRRIPGHQRHPVRLAAVARRRARQPVRGRRRRPVHLWLARRQGREHPRLRARLSRRPDHPPGAELPLHRQHPQGGQRGDRQQPLAARQGSVDRRTGTASRSASTRAFNEVDEARFVVDRLQDFVDQGARRSEVAILYRSKAQSRLFEEALIQAGIPYRVYGGLRFFERAEIKDALAYLRLVDLESPRRRLVRARGQSAAARHRPQDARCGARSRARFRLFTVASK